MYYESEFGFGLLDKRKWMKQFACVDASND